MKRVLISLSATIVFAVTGPAGAGTFYGNPVVKVVLDSGSPVEIGALRVYSCPGSETADINGTLTTSNYLTGTVSEGTWCDMDIQVEWAGTSGYEVVTVDGFTTFITDDAEDQVVVVIDPVTKTATLQ